MTGRRQHLVATVAVLALASLGPGAQPARAADSTFVEPGFAVGAQWLSARAGYAKATGEQSPDGMVGYGFGYRRFFMNRWAAGAFVHHELLGRFGAAARIEIPLTLEITRHTRWGAAFHPYAGVGGGAFFEKTYRSGADASGFKAARFAVLGFHAPLASGQLLGLDIRVAVVDKPDATPTFVGLPPGHSDLGDVLANPNLIVINDDKSKTEMHWSVKVDYAFAY